MKRYKNDKEWKYKKIRKIYDTDNTGLRTIKKFKKWNINIRDNLNAQINYRNNFIIIKYLLI